MFHSSGHKAQSFFASSARVGFLDTCPLLSWFPQVPLVAALNMESDEAVADNDDESKATRRFLVSST